MINNIPVLYSIYRIPFNICMKKHRKDSYHSDICSDDMTFEECELAILRHAVDKGNAIKKRMAVHQDGVGDIVAIVEKFLREKKLMCYGGTAVNNILPKEAQFYDYETEIPDYDFFSKSALQDAKELADIYYAAGYDNVEAKSGVHHGTYKVFVNFIPIADITALHPKLFDALYDDHIVVDGIGYVPPNYLRMSMFLELSRPQGDLTRWEKVMTRMNLLNKYYPLDPYSAKCNHVDFQRNVESAENDAERVYYTVRDALIRDKVVFFGGYAASLYSKYMPPSQRHLIYKIPDFDVLSLDIRQTAENVRDALLKKGVADIRLMAHTALGEVVPEHIEVVANDVPVVYIYKPLSCHSYNSVYMNNRKIRVATIDTMLSFYMAFLYANKPYFNKNRILCMSAFLFKVEQHNRLEQRGLLRRFTLKCYGKQETLDDVRAKKTKKYRELKMGKNVGKYNAEEYEEWFLKYSPGEKIKLRRQNLTNNDNLSVDTRKTDAFSKSREMTDNVAESVAEPADTTNSINIPDADDEERLSQALESQALESQNSIDKSEIMDEVDVSNISNAVYTKQSTKKQYTAPEPAPQHISVKKRRSRRQNKQPKLSEPTFSLFPVPSLVFPGQKRKRRRSQRKNKYNMNAADV